MLHGTRLLVDSGGAWAYCPLGLVPFLLQGLTFSSWASSTFLPSQAQLRLVK